MAFLLAMLPGIGSAEVIYSQEEAFRIVFPQAERIDRRVFILSAAEMAAIESRAKSRLSSHLFTFFEGVHAGVSVGIAVIDSHPVRTMTETVMIVISPRGQVEKTLVLAFHEPAEYGVSERWLNRFTGKALTEDLLPGREIPRIAGSTLTADAVSASVRRALAAFEVLLLKKGAAQVGSPR